MMKSCVTIWLIILLAAPATQAQYFPEKAFPDLFRDVQLGHVFPDSKTFADAVPLYPTDVINQAYNTQKTKAGFSLSTFISDHFLVRHDGNVSEKDTAIIPIREHIEKLWLQLQRPPILRDSGSLLALPYPYIVPGGRFNEIYYWDSYFTMLGLEVSGKKETMRNLVADFGNLIDRYGFIPNGNRSYYLTRSQPPYFSMMVGLISKEADSMEVFTTRLPQLLKEYAFWMNGKDSLGKNRKTFRRVVLMENKAILNRYWDDSDYPRTESYREDMMLGNYNERAAIYRDIRAACESGWDFSSRWLKDGIHLLSIHTTEIIPVDLNCLLYQLEKTIARIYRSQNDQRHYLEFHNKATARKTAILQYCWNERLSFFTDYDLVQQKPTAVMSPAGLFPLFFQLADSSQVNHAAANLQQYLLFEGGVISSISLTHQQWDAPNGWAPLQYISYEACRRNGRQALADSIAVRWMRTVENTYSRTGKLMEKYNVIYPGIPGGGGEYPGQDGFGWTNGVYLYFKKAMENRN